MSQENVEAMRALAEDWNNDARDFTTERLDRLDPELEIHGPLSSLAGKPYVGIEGARRWLSDIADRFDVWEGRDYEFRALSDDRVLTFTTIHAHGRGSGVELAWPTTMLAHFRRGRLLRLTIYRDRAEALRAVGLEE